jgi:hypothetical protein
MGTKLSDPSTWLRLGGVFFGIGAALSVASLAVSIPRWTLASTGSVATGTIVAMQRSSKSSRPVVEFTPQNHRPIRTTMTVGGQGGHIGDKVRVFYDPNDPEDNVADTFSELWFFCLLLGGMGVMWFVIGGPFLVLGVVRRLARSRVKRTGWHIPARVVHNTPVQTRNGYTYEPIVEGMDPVIRESARFDGERASALYPVGYPAVVHVEPNPPHRYFVEFAKQGDPRA